MIIINRKQATVTGLSKYFLGTSCPHGHVCERYTGSAECVECRKVIDAKPRRNCCTNPAHTDKYANGRCANCARVRVIKWQRENKAKHKLNIQKKNGLPVATRPIPNVCEACGNPEKKIHHFTGRVQSLSLDHCHNTGRFRGWLCNTCNKALSTHGNEIEWLTKLIEYVRKYGAQ